MNKLEKNFMKKIISYIFIAYTLSISSNSLCMFLTNKLLKTTSCQRYARSASMLPEHCYATLYNENKKNEVKLCLLRRNPSSNLREIWRLEDSIKRNRRALIAYRKNENSIIFDETME